MSGRSVCLAALVLAVAACAPLTPEQVTEQKRQFDGEYECGLQARSLSGDDPAFLDDGEPLSIVYIRAYQDCLARNGLPPDYPKG